MDAEVRRLRHAVVSRKARQENPIGELQDEPEPAPSPRASREAAAQATPVVVVHRPVEGATRKTPRSLLSLSTMRSRHFRILR